MIWLPASFWLFANDKPAMGVFLLVWGVFAISSVDNILRPKLVGKDTQMHELFILLGTLGGIFLFGAVGFIIGPIVAALFVTVWDIYGTAFRDVLPPAGIGGSPPEPPA